MFEALRPGSKWNQAIVLFRSWSRDQDVFWV